MQKTAGVSRLPVGLLLLATLAGSAGCSKKIWITQWPAFYTPKLKTIAVVPFRNRSGAANAGDIISDKLAAALSGTGAYKVFNRNDLKSLMDESDLRIALSEDAAAAVTKFRKFSDVQALLTGTVTTYAATSNRQNKRDPIYGLDRRGNTVIRGYRSYVHTRNEANVSVTSVLIRVSDGTTIYSTAQPAWARISSQGSPPRKDIYACAEQATDHVVAQLLEHFAPVRKQIKINPSKALRTATELYDNEWTFAKVFSAEDEKMYVVVALPPCCDRNAFRLTIVKKDRREDLAAQDIIWSNKHTGFGYLFSPKQIAAKAGPGQYEVKFYSGPKPVLKREFTIK